MTGESRFHYGVKSALAGIVFLLAIAAQAADEPRVLPKVNPLPTALSDDFEFRKVKLYLLGDAATAQTTRAVSRRFGGHSGTRATAAVAQASINFESRYRLHGAVTTLDRRERSGNYFDEIGRAHV